MVERRPEPRLPAKARQGLLRRIGVEPLDGDLATKPLVLGQPHRGHAAGPKPADDPVPLAELVPSANLGCDHSAPVPARYDDACAFSPCSWWTPSANSS